MSTDSYSTYKKFKPSELRRDTRDFFEKYHSKMTSNVDGIKYVWGLIGFVGFVCVFLPLGNVVFAILIYFILNKYTRPNDYFFEFPWRAPKHSNAMDASIDITKSVPDDIKKNPKAFLEYARRNRHKMRGAGYTYHGRCLETGLPVYSSNSDDRTHSIVLGGTGSGKTVYMLGLCNNQLVQNSGYIYIDAKGDMSVQLDHYRLLLRYHRQDDLLSINFVTSGRNMLKAQADKMTNSMNQMSNTSAGMLIEFLINLLNDSGGGDGMWKDRAIAFISALTRVLVYLRDTGVCQLSPKVFLDHMQLEVLEDLVFCHENRYGEDFERVLEPLMSYLHSVPGYKSDPKSLKKQEAKTREQHGYITMQLTKAINDLTFNYGHIFGVEHNGDIDMFDVVLNRRILTVPLPALERAPDTLKMLGKLMIGSIKQMMAGSLGNKIDGLRRKIIDTRPTSAATHFKLFLDEWGYIVIVGASVLPAQARSLNFSITFGAQTYSDLERGSKEEASATWGNTNAKMIGRSLEGAESMTYKLVSGFGGEVTQAEVSGIGSSGLVFNRFRENNSISLNKRSRVPIESITSQQDGEFTALLSMKSEGGRLSDVKVVRFLSFYPQSPAPEFLRIPDLCPIYTITKDELYDPTIKVEPFVKELKESHTLATMASNNSTKSSIADFKACIFLTSIVADGYGQKDLTSIVVNNLLALKITEDTEVEGREKEQVVMRVIGVDDINSSDKAMKTQKHFEVIKETLNKVETYEKVNVRQKQLQNFHVQNAQSDVISTGQFEHVSNDQLTENLLDKYNQPLGGNVAEAHADTSSNTTTNKAKNTEIAPAAPVQPLIVKRSVLDIHKYYDEICNFAQKYSLEVGDVSEYKIFDLPDHVLDDPAKAANLVATNRAAIESYVSNRKQSEIQEKLPEFSKESHQLITNALPVNILSLDDLMQQIDQIDILKIKKGIMVGK